MGGGLNGAGGSGEGKGGGGKGPGGGSGVGDCGGGGDHSACELAFKIEALNRTGESDGHSEIGDGTGGGS